VLTSTFLTSSFFRSSIDGRKERRARPPFFARSQWSRGVSDHDE
jgi:hypothetical protein